MKLSRLLGKLFSINKYRTIKRLPVERWQEVHDTGDLDWLFKTDDGDKISFEGFHWWGLRRLWIIGQRMGLLELWAKLYDEHIDKFGLDKDYRRSLEKRIDIAILQGERIITGERFLETMIAIETVDLDEMGDGLGGSSESYNFMECIAVIEKYFGKDVDPLKTSVLKYYTYLKMMKTSHNG